MNRFYIEKIYLVVINSLTCSPHFRRKENYVVYIVWNFYIEIYRVNMKQLHSDQATHHYHLCIVSIRHTKLVCVNIDFDHIWNHFHLFNITTENQNKIFGKWIIFLLQSHTIKCAIVSVSIARTIACIRFIVSHTVSIYWAINITITYIYRIERSEFDYGIILKTVVHTI